MTKPYRSICFNDERKWKSNHPLDDVLQVGIHKAIGYVIACPTSKFTCNVYGHDLYKVKELLLSKDRLVFLLSEDNNKKITLWAGDKIMIQSILDQQNKILVDAGWTTDAEHFFNKICNTDVCHNKNKELYHLIADLFNSWCLWCEDRIYVKGKRELQSSHPYDPDVNNG